MTRLWKHSVAVLLGLVALTPVYGVEPAVRTAGGGAPRANNNGPGLVQFRNGVTTGTGGAFRTQVQQNPQLPANVQQNLAAGAVLNQQLQAAQVNRPNAFPAQGVNTIPGQGAQAPIPQNLGNNLQGQPFVNPSNLLDEFGAPIRQPQNELAQRNQLLLARARALQQQLDDQNQTGISVNPELIEQALASGAFNGGGGYVGSMGGTLTTEESLMNGQARVVQSAGEYNRHSAEAIKTLEMARALALENARTGLKTYYDAKEANAAYRAKNAPEPLTKEKLDEWNRQDQPERLTRTQYNTDTGSLRWPALLQVQVFDDQRVILEDLFARRSANEYGVDSDFYRQVSQSTEILKNRLKDYLRTDEKFFQDEEYVTARNFLNSLAHEARLPPDIDGLAAR